MARVVGSMDVSFENERVEKRKEIRVWSDLVWAVCLLQATRPPGNALPRDCGQIGQAR